MSKQIPHDLHQLNWGPEQIAAAPRPTVQNVVSTFSLNNRALDPLELSRRIPGIMYNPKKFAACTCRTTRAVGLLFYRGSGVCPGAPSIEDSRLASLEIANVLLRAGQVVQWRNFRVQNIVCRAACNFFVDLNRIANDYPTNTQYIPTTFPGLTFRLISPAVVFIIFVSGRCIVTAARTFKESELAWSWFYTQVLLHYRLSNHTSLSSNKYLLETLRKDHTLAFHSERLFSQHVRRIQQSRQIDEDDDDDDDDDMMELSLFADDNPDDVGPDKQDKRHNASKALKDMTALSGPVDAGAMKFFDAIY